MDEGALVVYEEPISEIISNVVSMLFPNSVIQQAAQVSRLVLNRIEGQISIAYMANEMYEILSPFMWEGLASAAIYLIGRRGWSFISRMSLWTIISLLPEVPRVVVSNLKKLSGGSVSRVTSALKGYLQTVSQELSTQLQYLHLFMPKCHDSTRPGFSLIPPLRPGYSALPRKPGFEQYQPPLTKLPYAGRHTTMSPVGGSNGLPTSPPTAPPGWEDTNPPGMYDPDFLQYLEWLTYQGVIWSPEEAAYWEEYAEAGDY